MNILLTANFKKSLFVNGLSQNIIFLAEMLKDIGYNVSICVNHDVEKCTSPPLEILIMEEHEVGDYSFDYILQAGSALRKEAVDTIKSKNPRCKNIHMHYGNRLMTDVDLIKSNSQTPLKNYRVDEVWNSPHYSFATTYLQTYYKTQKVFEMPYIWKPKYIDSSLSYSPEVNKTITIMEPNLNMTKSCLMPAYLTDKVFREEPHLINKMKVYCSHNLRDKVYFRSLMSNLDIVSQGKSVFLGRTPMPDIFKNSNVIVSHQLLNSLNYTYLEALYLNIPLVHNSEEIKEAGYFYPEYDLNIGAKKLKEALKFHDENLTSYGEKSKDVLNRFSPENEYVHEQYKNLLS